MNVGFWVLSLPFLLLMTAGVVAQPINDLVFSVGTTSQDSGGNYWAYLQIGAPQPQILAGKRFAIYGKPGFRTNAAPFTLRGTIFQQTDSTAISNLLNQTVAVNEDLASLGNALNTLLHNIPGAASLPLPQKVITAFQLAGSDPSMAQAVLLLSRMHPGLALCSGQAYAGMITEITTFEVRDVNPAAGNAGDVLGRITLIPGPPIQLPAPGFPYQVTTNAPSDHLRIRLRWGTPDSLRRLSLLQFGFNIWRIPLADATAAGYDSIPPTPAQLLSDPKFRRVNTAPVMAFRDYAPLIGPGGPTDLSDRTTYFFADDNGRSLGNAHFPSNSPPHLGYLNAPFNDGDQFYYFITARDILGRDGLVSPGGQAMACRRLPPLAPTNPRVLNTIAPGTTNQQRLLISWQQNTATNDLVSEYWVYRWLNATMALTNDSVPLSNRVAVVAHIPGTNVNAYLDASGNAPAISGPSNYWYTIRAVSQAACAPLLSPHSPPAAGVLRERAAPPATTGELIGSCGTPVAMFQKFNSLLNPKGPDTNNWNYRVTCQRRDAGIGWVQIVVGSPFLLIGTQTYGPLYFPPDGDTVSIDVSIPVKSSGADFQATCFAGTYYGQVSQSAFCQSTNPVPPAEITEASFSCGELLFTALSSSDPFLQAADGNQSVCYPAINPTPDASGTVRMQFDATVSGPLLIQYASFTNTVPIWHDLGVATRDTNGYYSVFFEPCLIGPLPPFRGCTINLPGEGACEQHISRAGDGGSVAPIFIRFHLTPRTHEFRLYRSMNGGEPTLIAQGASLYDLLNPNKEIVRTDDAMPPSAARLCYFVQTLDENGNGSPLALIGCLDNKPPKPPRPVLSEPAPAGDASNPQVALNWFCPTAGVYRFEVRIQRADQPDSGKPTGFHSVQLIRLPTYRPQSRFYGLLSDRLATVSFDETQLTPPVGPSFGPGPQFSLAAVVVPDVPYRISVAAEDAQGNWGDASQSWSFTWKPPPTIQTVPWPSRPMPPVTGFDDPTVATNQVSYAPRVAAVVFTNSDGTLLDTHYPVGIRFAEIRNTGQWIDNVGNSNLVTLYFFGPDMTPASPGVDPNSVVFKRYSRGPLENGQPLLPMVVYRQQVTNSNFVRVSGNLTQVTPLLDRVPWSAGGSPGNFVSVTIPDRLIALTFEGSADNHNFLYLRDQQPVIFGARYHYYVARLNDQREVGEIIDAGTVSIPNP